MAAQATRITFESPALNERIMRLRQVDNFTNLAYLGLEYLTLAVVIGGAIVFAEQRASWGFDRLWNVPVFTLAVLLIGGIQHRLAGLGHEASHYTLVRNKFWNDLLADFFCMFPILTNVHFYRLFHMAHHQYTNDRRRDPDLVNLGKSKMADDFPMSRWQFVKSVYLRALIAPLSFARYQWDYVYVNVLGKGGNVYMKRLPDGDAESPWPRLGTLLGLVYLFGFNLLLWYLTQSRHITWMIPSALGGLVLVAAVSWVLPDRALFRSPFRQPYSPRFGGIARLSYFTIALLVLAHVRWATGGRSTIYFSLLWLLPMVTTFGFYMLLRDVYQHSNADEGRLTNSRIFFVDPFTRWAVFVYGQDIHVTHHLFPAIPHYQLRRLHGILQREHRDYADQVVECHGTFANRDSHPTILDVLTIPHVGKRLKRHGGQIAVPAIHQPQTTAARETARRADF